MAEEEKPAEGGGEAPAEAAPPPPEAPRRPINFKLIVVLANSVLILVALGVLAYTQLLYQRPAMVEEVEILKKQDELKKAPVPIERPTFAFDQKFVNIAMTSGKGHYVTIAWSAECRDEGIYDQVRQKKDIMTDKVIAILGRRQMSELNTIQGKLLLKTELIREFNALTEAGGITDIYFSTFLLQ